MALIKASSASSGQQVSLWHGHPLPRRPPEEDQAREYCVLISIIKGSQGFSKRERWQGATSSHRSNHSSHTPDCTALHYTTLEHKLGTSFMEKTEQQDTYAILHKAGLHIYIFLIYSIFRTQPSLILHFWGI